MSCIFKCYTPHIHVSDTFYGIHCTHPSDTTYLCRSNTMTAAILYKRRKGGRERERSKGILMRIKIVIEGTSIGCNS